MEYISTYDDSASLDSADSDDGETISQQQQQHQQSLFLDLTSTSPESSDVDEFDQEPTSNDEPRARHEEDFHLNMDAELDRCKTPESNSSTVPMPGTAETPRKGSVKKYAISEDSLPSEMLTFLRHLRVYFLKSVNLERQKGPITPSTMDKAQERILCKCF